MFSERRKRLSESYREISISDDEDEVDKMVPNKVDHEDKLKVRLYEFIPLPRLKSVSVNNYVEVATEKLIVQILPLTFFQNFNFWNKNDLERVLRTFSCLQVHEVGISCAFPITLYLPLILECQGVTA